MTAWLVSEDTFRLARVDSITSVELALGDEAEAREKYHPVKRLARARGACILVGAHGLDRPICALTCPGRDAQHALRQLLTVLAHVREKDAGNLASVYVHAIYPSWPSRTPEQVWSVTSDMPEPEWIQH